MLKLDPKARDLTGRRFGRLVVQGNPVRHRYPSGGTQLKWHCVCDCGAKTLVFARPLNDGSTTSCGCWLREWCSKTKRTHGQSHTDVYRIWTLIKNRCYQPSSQSFKEYGARGIAMSDEWRDDFEAFRRDMGERPSSRHQIERVDNDGPYCKENCVWATQAVQANNKRNNVRLDIDGQSLTVSQWSRVSGIPFKVIFKRLSRGWSGRDAVYLPLGTIVAPLGRKRGRKKANA